MKALRAEKYPELQLTQMGIKHKNQFDNAPLMINHGSSKIVYEGHHGGAAASIQVKQYNHRIVRSQNIATPLHYFLA
jgi:hypothetical protein